MKLCLFDIFTIKSEGDLSRNVMVTWLRNSSAVKCLTSLNCSKGVAHRGICIGKESLFSNSRHALRPPIFSGSASIDGKIVGGSGHGISYL